MIDRQLHLYSGLGTVSSAVLAVGLVMLNAYSGTGAHATSDDPYANMQVIDAALAELSKQPERQPQRKTRPPPPPVNPVGVTTDETAKPETKEDDPPPKPLNAEDVLDKYRRREDEDEDEPVGKPAPIERGSIDGSEVGFGDKTFGDPYLGLLKSTFLRLWEYPEILDDVGTPIGCIRLKDDGSIEEVRLATPSGNGDLDASVEKALADFMKKVNEDPTPVPPQLSDLTRIPLCWRMNVQKR